MSGRTRKAIVSLFAVAAIFHLVQSPAVAKVSKADVVFYNSEMKTIIDYLASFGGDASDPSTPAGAAKLLAEKLANDQINYRDDLPPGVLGENKPPFTGTLHVSTSAFFGSSAAPIKFDPKNPAHVKNIASFIATLFHELYHSRYHGYAYRILSNSGGMLSCGNPMEASAHSKTVFFMLGLATVRKLQLEELRKKLPKNDPQIALALEEIIALNSAAETELSAIFENGYTKDERHSKILMKLRGEINLDSEELRSLSDALKRSDSDKAMGDKGGDQSAVPGSLDSALKASGLLASVTPDLKVIDAASAAAVEKNCKLKTAIGSPPAAAERKKKKKVAKKKTPRRAAREGPPSAQPNSAPAIQFGIGVGFGSSSHGGRGGGHHQDGGRIGGR